MGTQKTTGLEEHVLDVELTPKQRKELNNLYNNYNAYTTKRRIDILQKFTGEPHLEIPNNEQALENRLKYLEIVWQRTREAENAQPEVLYH